MGRALGVVAIDMDGDGWVDLFVARDASPNLLLMNQKNGTFRDAGFEAEVAFNADGVARAGMGVDAGDVDGDGRPDIVVTNFDSEYHALYLNTGKFPFREATVSSKLAAHTKPYVGWGVRFIDYDNDGDLDLLIVNGHLHEMISESNRSVSYRQPPLLLRTTAKASLKTWPSPRVRRFKKAIWAGASLSATSITTALSTRRLSACKGRPFCFAIRPPPEITGWGFSFTARAATATRSARGSRFEKAAGR